MVVRRNWSYSDLMPVIPSLGIGLSPVLQWVVIPALALWLAGWPAGAGAGEWLRGFSMRLYHYSRPRLPRCNPLC